MIETFDARGFPFLGLSQIPQGNHFSLLSRTLVTAASTYTPPAHTRALFVAVVGGGGGGGGAGTAAASGSAGAGGSGGSTGYVFLVNTFPTYGCTIGSGGSAGNSAGTVSGGTGGATQFRAPLPGNNTILVEARGGGGGVGMAGSSVPARRNAGTPGSWGGIGNYGQDGRAGGFSYLESLLIMASGDGGSSVFGMGAAGRVDQGVGRTGGNYGGGGSGACCVNAGTAVTGGAGAPGAILIWEFA